MVIGAQAFSYAYFGEGTGEILLDNVYCRGNEPRLIDCHRLSPVIGYHNCLHYEDAGVHCYITQVCTHGDTRLTNGQNSFEGELELCYNGIWGKACISSYYQYYTQNNADVACRSMFSSDRGMNIYISFTFHPIIDSSVLINKWSYPDRGVISYVRCTGSEKNLLQCSHNINKYCYTSILSCYPVWKYIGEPYLLPGPSSGRLLVYYDGSWGTVCKDGFSVNDARVVCSELRQPTASKYINCMDYKCISLIQYRSKSIQR